MNDDTKKILIGILYVIVGVFILAIGSVLIDQGADIIADVIADILDRIMYLFKWADLNPNNRRGFGCCIELIAIAIFVGWTISRFRRK